MRQERKYEAEIRKVGRRYYVRAAWWPELNERYSPDFLGCWWTSDFSCAKGYWTLKGAKRGAKKWAKTLQRRP